VKRSNHAPEPPDSWIPDRAGPVPHAVEFLLARCDPASGPILQLLCGEGAWLLALARAGRTVAGIHSSRPTLARLRRRLEAEPPGVAARVTLECGDVREFDFPRGAGAVALLASALPMLPTREERLQVLRRSRAALAPGGVLFVDVRRPPATLFPEEGFRALSREGPFDEPESGRRLWRSTRLGRDRAAGRLLVRHAWTDADGRLVRESGIDLADSGTEAFREEVAAAGFAEREVLGGFDGTPYDAGAPGGRLLLVAGPG